MLFDGSTSVLTINDGIVDARVTEEQRHMERLTNEEEDRRPDEVRSRSTMMRNTICRLVPLVTQDNSLGALL